MPDSQGYIPVYLADRTIVGKARVAPDGRHVDISFDQSINIEGLMENNLVGLSIVYQRAEAIDVINEARGREGDKPDE